MKVIAAALLILTSATASSFAYTYPGRPNCPTNNPKFTWTEYLNGRAQDRNHAFSLLINRVNHNVGPFVVNKCNSGTVSNGTLVISYGSTPKGSLDVRSGPIDPKTRRFAIGGRTFHFSDAGDVFDAEFGLVGTLRCTLGSVC
jgi:hypothetical protein